jgi:nucleotide-binding universal stress UspA family protein
LPTDGSAVDALRDAAAREHCDVLVAGAYGHSRMREWMLGGVTRDLLLSPQRCALVTH